MAIALNLNNNDCCYVLFGCSFCIYFQDKPHCTSKNLSSHSMQYLQLQTKFCLPFLAQKQANCQLGLLFPTRFCQDFSPHLQDSQRVSTKLDLYFTNITKIRDWRFSSMSLQFSFRLRPFGQSESRKLTFIWNLHCNVQ